jgi:hypothetical protein
MNDKVVRVLISLLHVCLFVLAIVVLHTGIMADKATAGNASNDMLEKVYKSEEETVVEVKPEVETLIETQPQTEIQTEIQSEPQTESQMETQIEIQTQTQTQDVTVICITRYHPLNIRESPNQKSKILGVMKKGDTATLIEMESEEWAYVRYGDIEGDCYAKYLKVE